MRSVGVIAVFVALVAVGAWFVFAGPRRAGVPAERASAAAATGTLERGQVIGAFDPEMSGCRYSCAVSQPYDAVDLSAQPGVGAGALTQCPVSGVMFAVDEGRPHVSIETGEYVFCCDTCAKRFEKEPGRFVSL